MFQLVQRAQVVGSIPAGSGSILSWRLVISMVILSVVSFWQKNVHKYLLNVLRTKPVQEKCVGKEVTEPLNSKPTNHKIHSDKSAHP